MLLVVQYELSAASKSSKDEKTSPSCKRAAIFLENGFNGISVGLSGIHAHAQIIGVEI